MVSVFQNNYPERLKVAIVYPVPASFVSLVRQVMWCPGLTNSLSASSLDTPSPTFSAMRPYRFVDENTRSKVESRLQIGGFCSVSTLAHGSWLLPEDMETEEQPLLARFGYRPDDLPPEIRGGYRGVGERWKPDVFWSSVESVTG